MAKKKIKKFLKKAAPLLAVAGLGKAFMNARNRKNQMKQFLATEGGDLSDMRNYGPFSKGPGFVPVNMMTPQDMANDSMFIDAMAAKGGRIMKTKKGGKAVKGFAKKKKQANKMRKK